jgi:hypothetical protein
MTTGTEVASLPNAFTVQIPAITSVTPNSGQASQSPLSVAIVGQYTHFVNGTTKADFGAGITINSTTVADATHATANITIAPTASGTRTVTMTTGLEVAALPNGFTINPPTTSAPTISGFTPPSGTIGTLVTLNGTNFGTAPQISMPKLGGGTVNPPPSSIAPPNSCS